MLKGNLKRIYGENDNKLPVGPYVLNFISEDGELYCGDCAQDLIDDEYIILIDTYIHWEGESLYCEKCGNNIESEYGGE